MTVFEAIKAQQKGKENTAPWMVGEQLKDICREDPACAEIVLQDLENKDMSIEAAERQIKAYADKQNKKNGCVCIPPNVAERIIREFYGLPEAATEQMPEPIQINEPEKGLDLDLASFF